MRKLKLDRITGIVALSYLVLLPAGVFYIHKKTQAMDEDMTVMWDKLELEPQDAKPIFDINRWLQGLRSR